jgi:acid phosphatase type 7
VRTMWFRDGATATVALGAAVIAMLGIAVSVWYVLPRADQDGAAAGTTTSVAPTTTTFAADADTYVQADTATTNYGTALQVVVDRSPERRTLLRFTVTGLTDPVIRAVLRLHTVGDNTGSSHGGTWRAVTDTAWSENAVTWETQPEIDGATAGELGAVTSSTWYEIDVTRLVTGNGTYTIAGTSTDEDGAYYDTRETGASAPHLVVTTAPNP